MNNSSLDAEFGQMGIRVCNRSQDELSEEEAASEEEYEGTPKPPVPIDICMKPDTRCVIITGPNTGGKTATLKVPPLTFFEFTAHGQNPRS